LSVRPFLVAAGLALAPCAFGELPEVALRDCSVCPELVVVPAGTFTRGSSAAEQRPAETPQHLVKISAPFAIGKYEVTFDEWDACVREHGCRYVPDDRGWGRGRHPVIHVSWDDAQQYVQWLSRKARRDYRLPSEAEWEYAARAGTVTPYAFGQHISPQQANYYTRGTSPVGAFAPNRFDLHDMHGNVWEWTADCWNDNYVGAPRDADPRRSGDCSRRVVRGGSWDDYPWFLRSAERSSGRATIRLNDLGFRVAASLRPQGLSAR
jgi:formylglycine-generating enzyme required for sulfatase activity